MAFPGHPGKKLSFCWLNLGKVLLTIFCSQNGHFSAALCACSYQWKVPEGFKLSIPPRLRLLRSLGLTETANWPLPLNTKLTAENWKQQDTGMGICFQINCRLHAKNEPIPKNSPKMRQFGYTPSLSILLSTSKKSLKKVVTKCVSLI